MNLLNRVVTRIESLPHESKVRAGLGLVLASSFLFSLSNMFVKQITEFFSPFTVAFWRGWVGLMIILVFIRFDLRRVRGRNIKMLVLRGILGTLSLSAFFTSIHYTTLSNSVGLFNTYPLWTALVGMLFFRERWRNVYLLALLCSAGGVWLIVRPDLGRAGMGEVLGLSSAFIVGWIINIVRSLRKTDSVFSIVFYFTAFTSIITLFPAGTREITLSISAWPGLFLVGFLMTIGQLLMTGGYTFCSATGGGIVSLLGLPFTLLLSTLFLGERFDAFIGAGTLLIFLSGFLIVFSRKNARIEKLKG